MGSTSPPPPTPPASPAFVSVAPTLTKEDVERFGRQMLVAEIGAAHMAQIRKAHVVCIGAGGLGSTVLFYLAAAGVGRLTVVDFDAVEVSNLHRQIIHTTAAVGQPKAESARDACRRLFPAARVEARVTALCPANAEALLADGDVVVDGTDNVAARYLINDAAMRRGKPLVSGSAMGWDGQLSVYGVGGGPCYRCVFPQPPPREAVGSCNDSGVMGPLPGMIGCLQALEVLKVVTGVGEPLSGRLFLFNGLRLTSRVVTLRGRQPQCPACSPAAVADPTSLAQLAAAERPEYAATSCAAPASTRSTTASCTATAYAARVKADAGPSAGADGRAPRCITLDVRVELQFEMAHLPHAAHVPLQRLQQWKRAGTLLPKLADLLERDVATGAASSAEPPVPVYVVCRRGINSVKAVDLIEAALAEAASAEATTHGDAADAVARFSRFTFVNVEGGLNAYHREVDREFPFY